MLTKRLYRNIATLLTQIQESGIRTLYKHFTSVSPGQSGHYFPSLRAPMLGGQPLTDMVSSKQTRTARLWIRRVLVRSQEGQLERPQRFARGRFSLPCRLVGALKAA